MSGDHVHSGQSEKWGGGEEVTVVGMDFDEAVCGGGGEVEGIGGADSGGRGE